MCNLFKFICNQLDYIKKIESNWSRSLYDFQVDGKFIWVRFWFSSLHICYKSWASTMILLSSLSISSRDFTFNFPKMSRTNRDVLITYKPTIIP